MKEGCRPNRCAGRLATLLMAFPVAAAGFDIDLLRQRGISPDIASYLAQESRFTPGHHEVTLKVNGQTLRSTRVLFDDDGALCFDAALLEVAQLNAPGPEFTLPGSACSDFVGAYPQTEITLDPGTFSVELVVPTQALSPQVHLQDWSHHDSGGLAGIVNYDLSWMNARTNVGSQQAWLGRTELGVNAGNWILRSNQLLSRMDDRQRTQVLDAYAQRTFSDHASVFQVGQVDLGNPVLSSAPIHGFQVFPEQALSRRSAGRVVDGTAQGQARVDIRQAGRVVHSTVVPAGPFAITLPANLDASAALQVVITEADGQQQTRELPALPSLALGAVNGVSFGLGVVRDVEKTPWLASGGWVGASSTGITLGAGALASEGYQSVGFGLGQALWAGAQLHAALNQASARSLGASGAQGQLLMSQKLAEEWSASIGLGRQSSGYRQLQEALNDTPGREAGARERGHHSLGLSWNHPWLGGVQGTFSQMQLSNGQRSQRVGLGWSARFYQATFSANAQWSVDGHSGRKSALYLSVGVPLGGSRRLRSSWHEQANNRRLGVTMQETVSDTFGYRLGMQRNSRDGLLHSQVGMNLMSRFNQMQFDHSDNGGGARQFSANVRGGAVLHDAGVTLSPYPLQDTFALLRVGEMENIKVHTPGGPVWTDRHGRAVAPQVRPYTPNALQVESRSLPRNAELANGAASLLASRGAVPRLSFDVLQRQRLLLLATHDGQPLTAGATVIDSDGGLVALVQGDGLIFLHDVKPDMPLRVTGITQQTCVLDFQVPSVSDENLYYETVPATCVPV